MSRMLLAVVVVSGIVVDVNAEPYAGGLFALVEPDSDRGADDGLGFNLLYGWQWRERLYPEITIHGASFDTGSSGGSDFSQWGAGADLRYELGHYDWQPYILGGLGVVRNDAVPNSLDSTDVYANAALGVLSPEFIYGVRFRAEARLLFDSYEDNQTDLRLGVGLHIPLGRTKTVVEVVEVEKVVYAEIVADSDSDGVTDDLDNCPATLEGAIVNQVGCVVEQNIVLRNVNFEFDSAELRSDSRETLDQVAATLRGEPNVVAEIAGHTDDVGSDGYNLRLSSARANAVRSYLMARGVEGDRISARGYGETEPVASNSSDSGRAANRRVEFRVRVLPASGGGAL